MKTYNSFILENNYWKGTEILNPIETAKLIKEHCTEFSFDDLDINRSVVKLRENDYYKINPKISTRISHNSIPNIYTLIMDNTWLKKEKYPLRSKSIICTLGGKYKDFRVIPFDGSQWGVCKKYQDIWWLWNKRTLPLGLQYNSDILNLLKLCIKDLSNDNYNLMVKQLENFNFEDTKKRLIEEDSYYIPYLEKLRIVLKEKDMNLSEFLHNLYLNDGGFEKLSYKELIKLPNQENEIWTDSKCLLVNPRLTSTIELELSKL